MSLYPDVALENKLNKYIERVARMVLLHEFEEHDATPDDIMIRYGHYAATDPEGTGIHRQWVDQEYLKWKASS